MTTVEKLNYLISIKSDIKTAIENKGVDMTGVSFLGYASKIGEIVSGVGYTDRDVIEGRYQYNISNSASFVYSSAFEYKSVQTVDLPNCLYVGNKAFFYCTSLTTVNIPVCTSLYNNAFRNCTNLTTVNLPSCTDLHSNAFRSCYNLNTIYMGIELSTVASMRSSNALLDCSALQSIYVPASLVDKYKSATNWSYYSSIIYPFDGPEPPVAEYYIKWTPSTAEGQFNIDGTTHNLSAFSGLYYWSTGIINENAFNNNITIQSIETNATDIYASAFQSCYSLSQMNLPACSYIGYSTFGDCSSLSQISLPMCSSIGDYAFYNCKSLSQISLPKCSHIGWDAFRSCDSLLQISLPVCNHIGNYAFYGCSSLLQISLPMCSSIGNHTFWKCFSLSQISLPKCSRIGDDAFYHCDSLSQISLPVCSYIGSYTFQFCYSLSQISIPKCSYIGRYAFEGCSSLLQISLPKCSDIKDGVFQNCKSLSQISLPMCSSIGAFAFWYCHSLSQISLPKCSYIGRFAFEGCRSLSIITIGYSGVCSLSSSVFYNTQITSSTGSIYVPASLVNAYKFASGWSEYSNRIYSIR